MATSPNSAIRPQSARRVSAVITAQTTTYTGTAAAIGAVQLVTVSPNGFSWLIKMSAAARATIAAFNVLLFWSPDGGTTLYYITKFACPGVTTAPGAETDFGLTVAASRELGPAGASFYVASDTALTGGIVVNAEIEDA